LTDAMTTTPDYDPQWIDDCAQVLTERCGAAAREARVALVTGSGLGALAQMGHKLAEVPFADLPGLGGATVVGHAGVWRLLGIGGAPTWCLLGRRHIYEGIDPRVAVLAVRGLARLGTRRLVLTNAAGGLASRLRVGDLMLIRDHMNLMGRNPLLGANDEALGPRFPDMSAPYDVEMADVLRERAEETGLRLAEGVYAALTGPTYETRAEVGMLRRLGADAVGMSTVPEVLAARHAGLRVSAISLITNSHARPGDETTHDEVLEMGRRSGASLRELLEPLLAQWAGQD
jgi:purine-nucleoside phosphorylase